MALLNYQLESGALNQRLAYLWAQNLVIQVIIYIIIHVNEKKQQEIG
jgi:hypothetical protein